MECLACGQNNTWLGVVASFCLQVLGKMAAVERWKILRGWSAKQYGSQGFPVSCSKLAANTSQNGRAAEWKLHLRALRSLNARIIEVSSMQTSSTCSICIIMRTVLHSFVKLLSSKVSKFFRKFVWLCQRFRRCRKSYSMRHHVWS